MVLLLHKDGSHREPQGGTYRLWRQSPVLKLNHVAHLHWKRRNFPSRSPGRVEEGDVKWWAEEEWDPHQRVGGSGNEGGGCFQEMLGK